MHWLAGNVLIFLVLCGIFTPAYAEITVEPTRVVLDSETRNAAITLTNDGRRQQIITAVWTDLIQAADANLYPTGQQIPLKQVGAVQVWPGKIELNPGESIQVSLLLDPANPLTGEVRRHLRFNIDPARGSGPRWGVVIPVFTRGPMPGPDVQILDVEGREDGNLMVSLHNRAGASPHGSLMVFDRDGRKLAELKNVNLYTQNQRITFALPLPNWPKGQFTVRYLGEAEYSGDVFAEMRFSIKLDQHR
jgi:hypothetical protein